MIFPRRGERREECWAAVGRRRRRHSSTGVGMGPTCSRRGPARGGRARTPLRSETHQRQGWSNVSQARKKVRTLGQRKAHFVFALDSERTRTRSRSLPQPRPQQTSLKAFGSSHVRNRIPRSVPYHHLHGANNLYGDLVASATAAAPAHPPPPRDIVLSDIAHSHPRGSRLPLPLPLPLPPADEILSVEAAHPAAAP